MDSADLEKAKKVFSDYLFDCDSDIEGCDVGELTEIEHHMEACRFIRARFLAAMTGEPYMVPGRNPEDREVRRKGALWGAEMVKEAVFAVKAEEGDPLHDGLARAEMEINVIVGMIEEGRLTEVDELVADLKASLLDTVSL